MYLDSLFMRRCPRILEIWRSAPAEEQPELREAIEAMSESGLLISERLINLIAPPPAPPPVTAFRRVYNTKKRRAAALTAVEE